MSEDWDVEKVFQEWEIYRPRKTWLEYHEMYNLGIQIILNTISDLSLEQKMETIKELGEKIDNDIQGLKLRTGRALSFSERSRRCIQRLKGVEKELAYPEEELKKKKKNWPAPIKTKQDKLAYRLETGLATERGSAFSLLESSILESDILESELNTKKVGEIDYRTWWIGDCIVWAIFEEYNIAWTEEEKKDFYMDIKELKQAEDYLAKLKKEYPKAYYRDVPNILLTDKEIREKTGRRDLSNKDIYNLVEKFVGVPITRRTNRKVGEDGDNWVRFFEIENICKVKGKETGKLSHRNKQPEHSYIFIFDTAAGLDFWNAVRLGLFDCRPPSYYKMPGGSQQILRAIGWSTKPSDLKLQELCRIAGIKDKNVTHQQKFIETYLTELVEKRYIESWKKRKKPIPGVGKSEIRYEILKMQSMPKA